MSTTTTTTTKVPRVQKDPNAPMDPADYTVIAERLTGTVKWFNNKAGFGFITVCEPGEYDGKDIFVHYSSIRVTNSQYKYLVQGEYVDFTLVKANSDTHEFQAMDISGVKGGPIMCETRRSSFPVDSSVGGGTGAATIRRDSAGPSRGPRARGPSQRSQNPSNAQGTKARSSDLVAEGRMPSEEEAKETTGTGEENLGFTKVQKKRRPPKAPVTPASV